MSISFKTPLLVATALAVLAAPVMLNSTPLADIAAQAQGKSEGKGKSGSKGKSSSSKSNSSSSKGKSAATKVASVNGSGKEKNLNAQLAGLNSLKRNINGLMNSSDPGMVELRSYVANGAALDIATVERAAAQGALTGLLGALDSYVDTSVAGVGLVAYDGSDVYADPTISGLQARQAELADVLATNPDNVEAQAEYDALTGVLNDINGSGELQAVVTQQGVISGLEGDIATYQSLTTEEALRAALLVAANDNRVAEAGGDAYLTPEIMAWAEQMLGVGDANGLIDAYVARQ